MQDLVSIVMPSYNTAAYIGESVRSVLAQTHTNWELLIVDDCSTDDTDAVVAAFADPRIRWFKNEKNSGAAVSRNRALREATGEWIAFLDSDDLWMPDKLERQLAFMKGNGHAFSYTAYREIDEASAPRGVTVTGPKRLTKALLRAYNWTGCLTVMYHAPTVGLIQVADLKKRNDYAMWLQAVRKSDCWFLDEVLAEYRVRTQSVSHDKLRRLLRSQYALYRVGERRGPAASAALTAVNMVFGVVKKKVFVHRGR